MGSGKTAVGRALAKRLGLPFADSDAEVESRTGVDIAYIFEREGEEGFRIRERDVIDAMTLEEGNALATGGGRNNAAMNLGAGPFVLDVTDAAAVERVVAALAPALGPTPQEETASGKVGAGVQRTTRSPPASVSLIVKPAGRPIPRQIIAG